MDATLSIDELRISFAHRGGAIEAVDGVSLRIAPSECVGIVGESGSGKTQLFLAVMGLLAANAEVAGRIQFEGHELLGNAARNRVRGSRLTMVFQDPLTCLTPHLTMSLLACSAMPLSQPPPSTY